MKVTLNFRGYPQNVESINDELIVTTSFGDVVNQGRISGYSDVELIRPTIENDGFFRWYNPDLSLGGECFVNISKKITEIISQVSGPSLYIGSFEENFVANHVFSDESITIHEGHAPIVGDIERTNGRLEHFHKNGVRAFATYLHSQYSSTGFVYPHTYHSTWTGGSISDPNNYAVMGYELPIIAEMKGVLCFRIPGQRTNTEVMLQYSMDGEDWITYGNIPSPELHQAGRTFDTFDFTRDSDNSNGYYEFDEPIKAKFIRVVAINTNNWRGLSAFIPVVQVYEQTAIKTHTYEELKYDKKFFEFEELDESYLLKSKLTNFNINALSTPSLERKIVRESKKHQYLLSNENIEFENPGEIIPGIKSTAEHIYSGGAFKLAPGTYLAKLELDIYSADYRAENPSFNRNIYSDNVSIGIYDAITNLPLCGHQHIKARHNGGMNPQSIDITATEDSRNNDNKWHLINAEQPALAKQYIGTAAVGGNGNVIVYDLKKSKTVKGFGVCSSYTYHIPHMNIEYSNDNVTWEIAVTEAPLTKTNFHWNQPIIFDNPIQARYWRFSNNAWNTTNSYGSYAKIIPIIENAPVLVEPTILHFEFTVNDDTQSIAFKHVLGQGIITASRLTLEQLSLGTAPRLIKTSDFDKPQLIPFNVNDITYSVNKKMGTVKNVWPGQDITLQFDSHFRLWRKGVVGQLDQINNLAIVKLPSLNDLSNKHLSLEESDEVVPFTEVLEPGMYRFSGSLPRTDDVWYVEYIKPVLEVPIGSEEITDIFPEPPPPEPEPEPEPEEIHLHTARRPYDNILTRMPLTFVEPGQDYSAVKDTNALIYVRNTGSSQLTANDDFKNVFTRPRTTKGLFNTLAGYEGENLTITIQFPKKIRIDAITEHLPAYPLQSNEEVFRTIKVRDVQGDLHSPMDIEIADGETLSTFGSVRNTANGLRTYGYYFDRVLITDLLEIEVTITPNTLSVLNYLSIYEVNDKEIFEQHITDLYDRKDTPDNPDPIEYGYIDHLADYPVYRLVDDGNTSDTLEQTSIVVSMFSSNFEVNADKDLASKMFDGKHNTLGVIPIPSDYPYEYVTTHAIDFPRLVKVNAIMEVLPANMSSTHQRFRNVYVSGFVAGSKKWDAKVTVTDTPDTDGNLRDPNVTNKTTYGYYIGDYEPVDEIRLNFSREDPNKHIAMNELVLLEVLNSTILKTLTDEANNI